jgi:HAD superfamily phosphoserine phosphatase-like hydrolase
MIVEGVFPADAVEGYAKELSAWHAREGTYAQYIQAVIKTFLRNIKGVHYGQFADIGRRVVAVQSKFVYRYTRNLIKRLKEDGYFLVAISQSPKAILDEFCGQYGFDKVYGRIYEIGPQDCLTGEAVDPHLIENKANIVKRVFAGHAHLTQASSIAVGDTENDISLLESVHEPICFNPNLVLHTHAKRVGWEVVVERKDVIYHLGKS